jgi:hypothetical protein
VNFGFHCVSNPDILQLRARWSIAERQLTAHEWHESNASYERDHRTCPLSAAVHYQWRRLVSDIFLGWAMLLGLPFASP